MIQLTRFSCADSGDGRGSCIRERTEALRVGTGSLPCLTFFTMNDNNSWYYSSFDFFNLILKTLFSCLRLDTHHFLIFNFQPAVGQEVEVLEQHCHRVDKLSFPCSLQGQQESGRAQSLASPPSCPPCHWPPRITNHIKILIFRTTWHLQVSSRSCQCSSAWQVKHEACSSGWFHRCVPKLRSSGVSTVVCQGKPWVPFLLSQGEKRDDTGSQGKPRKCLWSSTALRGDRSPWQWLSPAQLSPPGPASARPLRGATESAVSWSFHPPASR